MHHKDNLKLNRKKDGLSIIATQYLDDFKLKGFNPVYEAWIKKINRKDKLPRGKYFRRKDVYIIDVDSSTAPPARRLNKVNFNPFH